MAASDYDPFDIFPDADPLEAFPDADPSPPTSVDQPPQPQAIRAPKSWDDDDRDFLIRTVWGEASGGDADEMKAVANVIKNRSRGSGRSITDEIMKPGQFEPWMRRKRRRDMLALDPDGEDYRQIASIVDPILNDEEDDITGGATYFYAPEAQAKLKRRPPKWDDGTGRFYGRQKFFAHPYGDADDDIVEQMFALPPEERQAFLDQFAHKTLGIPLDLNEPAGTIGVGSTPEEPDHGPAAGPKRNPRRSSKPSVFDPEGNGFDFDTARAVGLQPDENGNWPGRDPRTGLLFQGRKSAAWDQTLSEEAAEGYEVKKGTDGRYYSIKIPGLLEPGNIDVAARRAHELEPGVIATVKSESFNIDGKEVLLPSIDENGKLLSADEIVEAYRGSGQHLGIFDTPESASAYAKGLSNRQGERFGKPVEEEAPYDPFEQFPDAGPEGGIVDTLLDVGKTAATAAQRFTAPIPALVSDITNPYVREWTLGMAKGAVDFVGGAGLAGMAGQEAAFDHVANETLQKYRDQLTKLPNMTEAELKAFYDQVNRPSSEGGANILERYYLSQAIKDVRSGKLTPDQLANLSEPLKVRDKKLYKRGQDAKEWAEETFGAAPGWEESVTRQLSEGFGSFLGGLPFAAAGPVGAGAVFVTAGQGEAVERAVEYQKKYEQAIETARARGLSEKQIEELEAKTPSEKQVVLAGLYGTVPGATDIVPIETALAFLRIPAAARRPLAMAIARIGGQTVIEGVQEGGQQWLQNLVAREVYDPSQDPYEDIGPNVAVGAGVGALVQTIGEVIKAAVPGKGRRVGVDETTPEDVEELIEATTPEEEATPEGPQEVPPSAPAAPQDPEFENAVLREYGLPDDVIADLDPEQRAYELEQAREQGVEERVYIKSGTKPETPEVAPSFSPEAPSKAPQTPSSAPVAAPALPPEQESARRAALERQASDQESGRVSPISTQPPDSSPGKSRNMRELQEEPAPGVLPETAQLEASESPTTDDIHQQVEGIAGQVQDLIDTVRGTKKAPVDVSELDDAARSVAATEATPDQRKAGNYQKVHAKFQGRGISIETPKGGTRKATDGSWEVPDMPADYGYWLGTEGTDGDHVDVLVGPNPDSPHAFSIEQKNPETGKFDEHKTFVGFDSPEAARAAYVGSFSDGKGEARIRALHQYSVDDFLKKLDAGEFKKRKRGEPKDEFADIPDAPIEGEISTPAEQLVEDEVRESLAAGYMDAVEGQSPIEAAISGVQDEIDSGSTHAPNGAPWADVLASLKERLPQPAQIEGPAQKDEFAAFPDAEPDEADVAMQGLAAMFNQKGKEAAAAEEAVDSEEGVDRNTRLIANLEAARRREPLPYPDMQLELFDLKYIEETKTNPRLLRAGAEALERAKAEQADTVQVADEEPDAGEIDLTIPEFLRRTGKPEEVTEQETVTVEATPEPATTVEQDMEAARQKFDEYLADKGSIKKLRFAIGVTEGVANRLMDEAVKDGRLIKTKVGYRHKPKGYDERIEAFKKSAEERRKAKGGETAKFEDEDTGSDTVRVADVGGSRMEDVAAQETAKRALEIAAAGNHSIALIGDETAIADLAAAYPSIGGDPATIRRDRDADIVIKVEPTSAAEREFAENGETAEEILSRVEKGRKHLPSVGEDPEQKATTLLDDAIRNYGFIDKNAVLRVAKTIAALDELDSMGRIHIAEALSYQIDREEAPSEPEAETVQDDDAGEFEADDDFDIGTKALYEKDMLPLLESVEKGEKIDDASLKELVTQKFVKTTKAGVKLLKTGKDTLTRLRKHAEEKRVLDEKLAKLPDDFDALTDFYLDATKRYDEAERKADLAAAEAAFNDMDLAEMKANGGTHSGIATHESPAEKLRRAATRPAGEIPGWGESGAFLASHEGVTAIVKKDGSSWSIYAVKFNDLFPSSTGYQSVLLDFARDYYGKTPRGMTVEEYAKVVIQASINYSKDTKVGRGVGLVLPEAVYELYDGTARFGRMELVREFERGAGVTLDSLPKGVTKKAIDEAVKGFEDEALSTKKSKYRGRTHPNNMILKIEEGGKLTPVREFPTEGSYLFFDTMWRGGEQTDNIRYVENAAKLDTPEGVKEPRPEPDFGEDEEIEEAEETAPEPEPEPEPEFAPKGNVLNQVKQFVALGNSEDRVWSRQWSELLDKAGPANILSALDKATKDADLGYYEAGHVRGLLRRVDDKLRGFAVPKGKPKGKGAKKAAAEALAAAKAEIEPLQEQAKALKERMDAVRTKLTEDAVKAVPGLESGMPVKLEAGILDPRTQVRMPFAIGRFYFRGDGDSASLNIAQGGDMLMLDPDDIRALKIVDDAEVAKASETPIWDFTWGEDREWNEGDGFTQEQLADLLNDVLRGDKQLVLHANGGYGEAAIAVGDFEGPTPDSPSSYIAVSANGRFNSREDALRSFIRAAQEKAGLDESDIIEIAQAVVDADAKAIEAVRAAEKAEYDALYNVLTKVESGEAISEDDRAKYDQYLKGKGKKVTLNARGKNWLTAENKRLEGDDTVTVSEAQPVEEAPPPTGEPAKTEEVEEAPEEGPRPDAKERQYRLDQILGEIRKKVPNFGLKGEELERAVDLHAQGLTIDELVERLHIEDVRQEDYPDVKDAVESATAETDEDFSGQPPSDREGTDEGRARSKPAGIEENGTPGQGQEGQGDRRPGDRPGEEELDDVDSQRVRQETSGISGDGEAASPQGIEGQRPADRVPERGRGRGRDSVRSPQGGADEQAEPSRKLRGEGQGTGSRPDNRRRDDQGRADLPAEVGFDFDSAFDDALDDVFGAEAQPEPAKKTGTDDRSTGDVARSAAKNAAEGAEEALKGLAEFFNKKGRLGGTVSGLPPFDEEDYARAKPMFIKAAAKFAASTRDLKELARRMVGELQRLYGLTREGLEHMRPYLKRFFEEVQAGTINLPTAEADQEIAEKTKANYRIIPEDEIGKGGPKDKVRRNIAAIRLLKEIEEQRREATDDEKRVLVRYVGWGAFAQDVFADHKPEWKQERVDLGDALTPEEYAAARKSTLNAHYTSPDVINGIWGVIKHLGYRGDRALEPSAGIGHFIGLQPRALATITKWSAVEIDSISGRIAKLLYADSDVNVKGFEEFERPPDFYDLVVSNVPFGDYNVHDPKRPGFLIHDYFFVKALDLVAPSGLVVFVTSKGTLDKAADRARKAIARKAEFLGAIRLPGGRKGAFAANAGTEVTTDIIFLRKRVEGEPDHGRAWMALKPVQTPEGETLINEYFADNPDMMLGEMRLQGSMYRGDEPVLIGNIENLERQIIEAGQKLPANATGLHGFGAAAEPVTIEASDGLKEGHYFEEDGKLYQKRQGLGVEVSMPAAQQDRVKAFIKVRDAVNAVLAEQASGKSSDAPARRKDLNEAYDAFFKRFGPINLTNVSVSSRKTKAGEPIITRRMPNLSTFKNDPDAYKVAAIENYDEETNTASKAAIFTVDVVLPAIKPPEVVSTADAVAISLNRFGRVDIAEISAMLNMSPADAIDALGEQIYLDPAGDVWRPAAEYLSGDVVEKLEQARAAAETDSKYERNIAPLEAVQPEPLTRTDIAATFGAPWIPRDVYEDFLNNEIGGRNVQLGRNPLTNSWKLLTGSMFNSAALSRWGTDRVSAAKIIEGALAQAPMRITYRNADGKKAFDEPATRDAQARVAELRALFSGDRSAGTEGWVWQDDERATRLESLYNRKFNRLVPQVYDGSHLTFPGLASSIALPNGEVVPFSLQKHQRDAVWRVVSKGNTLLAHVVGAGKTFTMIAAGMEQKRLGLVQRPMYVIPNHMLAQFSREFLQAYPNANLLVAEKESMTKDNRASFAARIAAERWDGIIITHDAFGRLPVSPEYYEDFLERELDDFDRMILEASQEEGSRGPTVKELMKRREKHEVKMKELLAKHRKDVAVTFEELGVDFLFVDEAHLFKNLSFITMMTRVRGLSQGASQRAMDLFLKLRLLEERRNGRSTVFATGTPISNTIAEMYTMQRYLQLDKLRQLGIDSFDAWAATFGQVVSRMELAADGRSFKETSSFSNFVNVDELLSLFTDVADIKTASMLNLPRPALDGGKPIIVESEPSELEELYIQHLVDRAATPMRPEPGGDNMLRVVNEGRQVATDMRLLGDKMGQFGFDIPPGMRIEFNPNGKVAKLVNNVFDIWKEGKHPGLAQLVFLDMGTPKAPKKVRPKTTGELEASAAENIFAVDDTEGVAVEDSILASELNLYQDIKDRLVARGVPKEHIAFIHDAGDDLKKGELFRKVRAGKVRVLIGSTNKMGVGTNVQTLLIALHHVDAPWKPAEVEQRDGRGLRQGNLNKELKIFRYITKRTFDSYMWQTLERKARFLSQFLAGARGARTVEDVDDPLPEAGELKAAATGDPRIMEHAELVKQERDLVAQKRSHERAAARSKQQYAFEKERLELLDKRIEMAEKDMKFLTDVTGDNFKIDLTPIGAGEMAKRKEAGEAILAFLGDQRATIWGRDPRVLKVGSISGYTAGFKMWRDGDGTIAARAFIQGALTYEGSAYTFSPESDPSGVAQRLANLVGAVSNAHLEAVESRDRIRQDLPKLEEQTRQKAWPKEEELRQVSARIEELTNELSAKARGSQPKGGSLGNVPPDDSRPPGRPQSAPSPARPSRAFSRLETDRRRKEFEGLLKDEIRRIAGSMPAVRFRDIIPREEAVSAEAEAAMRDLEARGVKFSKTAGGSYKWFDGMRPIITLAMADPAFDPLTNLYHESYHHTEAWYATNEEWQLLNDPRELERLKRKYVSPELGIAKDSVRMAPWEIRATSFQRYSRERTLGMDSLHAGGGIHIGIRRFFERLYQHFLRLRNALRGLGYQTTEDIFGIIYAGEAARTRTPREQPYIPGLTDSGRLKPGSLASIAGTPGVGERITAVAIKEANSDRIWSDVGVLHSDLWDRARDEMPDGTQSWFVDGFLTSEGRFVNREEAVGVAQRSGQLTGPPQEDEEGEYVQTEDIPDLDPDNILANIMPTNIEPEAQRGSMLARIAGRFGVTKKDLDHYLDPIRIKVQDKVLPIRRIQEAIEEATGQKLPVNLDVYMAEAIYHGRAGERLEDLDAKYVQPLIEFLRANDVSPAEIGDYLYAQHAVERNETIEQRDPSNTDGSGMSAEDAQIILGRVKDSGQESAYAEAARMVGKMLKETRRTLLRAGLIDRETFDEWEAQFQHYVPLRGWEVSEEGGEDRPRTGFGFDTRGPEAHIALGRRTKADNPLFYAVLQAQQAILRSEKNRVGFTMYRLVETHPNASRWEVFKGEYKKRFNPTTGLVEKVWLPPQIAARTGKHLREEDLFRVMVGGKPVWLQIHHKPLRRAMRNAGSEINGNMAVRGIQRLARVYASLLTSYNLEFPVPNAFRDLQTAIVNLSDVADKPEGTRLQIVKEALSLSAIRGVMAALNSHEGRTIFGAKRAADETLIGTKRSKTATEYAKWFDEFRLAGGKISLVEVNDVNTIRKRIMSSMTAGGLTRGGKAIARVVNNLNAAIENGVRLSTFIALRKAGVPADRAAFVSRELTANFTRKGELGSLINSAYIFFNASAQGTVRLAQALVRSRKARIAVAGMMVAGATLDLLNYLVAGDDDDGENVYDKIPDWVKERNLIFMNPWGRDYVTVPLPYGYNIFYLAGQQLMSVARGATKPLNAAGTVGAAAWDAFNPIGSAPSIAQFLSPTLLDPFFQITEGDGRGMTWFGGPIYPPNYEPNKPDSEKVLNAPGWIQDTARWLNSVTGGNVGRSGVIDISPETIEHFLEFAGGGAGKSILNTVGTANDLLFGDEWLPEKTPILRRFYGTAATTQARRRDFYAAYRDIDAAYYEFKQLLKAGDREGAEEARQRYSTELQFHKMMDRTRQAIGKMRDLRGRIEADTSLSSAEKRKRGDDLAAREKAMIEGALKAYNAAKAKN